MQGLGCYERGILREEEYFFQIQLSFDGRTAQQVRSHVTQRLPKNGKFELERLKLNEAGLDEQADQR